MSMSEHSGGSGGERSALVAEYVLGLLGPAEHRRVGDLIANDPAMRAEEQFWTGNFAALDAEFTETPVPPQLLARIETRLFGEPERAQPLSRFWDSLALWRSLAAGAVAVAVVAIGANVLRPEPGPATLATQLVAALDAEGSDVRFVALYDGSGTVRLTALGGTAVPDRDFELWAIQGTDDPVSMGVIPVDQRTQVPVSPEILAKWGEGSVLAITLEPKGGSPTGGPTGPIVAKGAVTQI